MRKVAAGKGYEKYCTTCHLWRTPRASHCNICGYCMVRAMLIQLQAARCIAEYCVASILALLWHSPGRAGKESLAITKMHAARQGTAGEEHPLALH